ncbi:MAG TPA: cytochrome c peroxidase [Anaeromyxobacteraceae bacterium]|nr:cytochrome c peroxidase [Anaeromyxobacteraceae bacterium]
MIAISRRLAPLALAAALWPAAPRAQGLQLPNRQLSAAELRFAAQNMGYTSLKQVTIPEPTNVAAYVKDRVALARLGKALFWDEQVGSDRQACASCHFHAGADNRSRNQINPGFRNAAVTGGDLTFGNSGIEALSRPAFGPNYQLTAADFPLHKLSNSLDQRSTVVSDTNDVVSSQGSFAASFQRTGVPGDVGRAVGGGALFHASGMELRSVAPRNTPSSVNAIFNDRSFWDSRGRGEFNGANPIGKLDPFAVVAEVVKTPRSNAATASLHPVRIDAASAASQAVGPPLSDVEMSYAGRTFADLGRKMLSPFVTPLSQQAVAPDDSLLGPLSRQRLRAGAKGLTVRYMDLVQAAFQPQWWNGGAWRVDVSGPAPVLRKAGQGGSSLFTVAEFNFPLLFGLAVREYEKTLVANDTPFDRFMEGSNTALPDGAVRGLQTFLGKGNCFFCHAGPELSNAAITNVQRRGRLIAAASGEGEPQTPDLLERMVMGNGGVAVYDTGHYNVGVRPTDEDLGIGATIGPQNQPLSNSRRLQRCQQERMAQGQTVEQATTTCEVPRILARPDEALRVLRQASALLGNPADVTALLDSAAALLGPNDPLANFSPDLFAASMPLRQAQALLAPRATDATTTRMVEGARMLLPDPVNPGNNRFAPLAPPLAPDERVAADGAFKVPALRNVALTAPYFHNGGQATLDQVVEFYDRGGDFADVNVQNLDPIRPLGLTDAESADLVTFLEALTDERTRWERAPFDHPSLSIPNGATPGRSTLSFFPGRAVLEDRVELPACGAGGNPAPYGTPHTPWANFLQPLD